MNRSYLEILFPFPCPVVDDPPVFDVELELSDGVVRMGGIFFGGVVRIDPLDDVFSSLLLPVSGGIICLLPVSGTMEFSSRLTFDVSMAF